VILYILTPVESCESSNLPATNHNLIEICEETMSKIQRLESFHSDVHAPKEKTCSFVADGGILESLVATPIAMRKLATLSSQRTEG
jgi:hypothetical protein